MDKEKIVAWSIFIGFVVFLSVIVAVYNIIPQQQEEELDFNTLARSPDDLPITTWEQARSLAYEKYGGQEIWNCSGENMTGFQGFNGTLPQKVDGYYGWPATMCAEWKTEKQNECVESEIQGFSVIMECNFIDERYPDGRPKSGKVGLSFWFDPNNGFIQRLGCNYYRYDNCPKYENGTYINIHKWHDDNPWHDRYTDIDYQR